MNKTLTVLTVVGVTALIVFNKSPLPCQADGSQDYNLSHHHITGKLDILTIQDELDGYQVLTNWGTKPEWLSDHEFVFLSNQIGDVFLMDLKTDRVRNLTGKFRHAGFTRAHKLNNGNLLLVGPESGSQPPDDPLAIYDKGQFTGCLWVFESPFDQAPYLLKREVSPENETRQQGNTSTILKVPAWEGVAVSQESNLLVWSDTQTPFFGKHVLETGFNYFFKPSNLWVGELVYSHGTPHLSNIRKIVSKWDVGAAFLEPQNFVGAKDQFVTFSAYGPSSTGASDTYIYDFQKDEITRMRVGKGYDEWEGIAPDYSKSFVEVDARASRFIGPESIELFLYNFSSNSMTRFTHFQGEHKREDGFFLHEPVFSPDGTQVLFTTSCAHGMEFNSPGYGIGIVLCKMDQ